MRRSRLVATVLWVALPAASAVLIATGGAGAAPSKSQELFRKTLLADERTTTTVKRLLDRGGGFVSPDVKFSDLTGDGRSDAVVLVDNGGIAGAVALYVFSTHGEEERSALRAVYRNQRLYRARATISGDTLIVRTPRFEAGDDVCCPVQDLERTYAWSDRAETLRLRSSRRIDQPSR